MSYYYAFKPWFNLILTHFLIVLVATPSYSQVRPAKIYKEALNNYSQKEYFETINSLKKIEDQYKEPHSESR
jgi:hypothetical protein